MFDEARKRPLPFLPEVIGVATSPTGAVIRDILHRLGDRFPRRVLLWPVKVQGEGAAEEIAAAIAGFNLLEPGGVAPRPDVLIVARGGGSIEDLWAFNEEVVVRAAAASEIPLISAVGHETDFTLIDLAADRRAPTPSAAAEMAVPVRAELVGRVLDLEGRLVAGMARRIESWRGEIKGLARGLPADPRRLLETAIQRLDAAAERLIGALRLVVERQRTRLPELRPGFLKAEIEHRREALAALGPRFAKAVGRVFDDARRRMEAQAQLLDSYGYQQVLERGFVLARDDGGRPVVSAAQATPGKGLALRFADGERHATVDAAPRRRRPNRAAPKSQRRLL